MPVPLQPAAYAPPAEMPPPSMGYSQPPTGMLAQPTVVTGSVPTYGQSNTRPNIDGAKAMKKFVPDGFHTSASDPVLQARYGHTKQEVNIAPPPTFAGASVPTHAPSAGAPAAPVQISNAPPPGTPYGTVPSPVPVAAFSTPLPAPIASTPYVQQGMQGRSAPTPVHITPAPLPSPYKMKPQSSPGSQDSGQLNTIPDSHNTGSAPSKASSLLGNKTLPGTEELLTMRADAPSSSSSSDIADSYHVAESLAAVKLIGNATHDAVPAGAIPQMSSKHSSLSSLSSNASSEDNTSILSAPVSAPAPASVFAPAPAPVFVVSDPVFSNAPAVNVFNPATDVGDVIDMSSSSSSVL